MEERIKNLQKQIEELKAWRVSNSKQQFEYPLGVTTQKIVRKDRMVPVNKKQLIPAYETSLEVSFKGIKFLVSASTDI